MSRDGYFSKKKTGGSNNSLGFSYQDACALYHLIKVLDDPCFSTLGVETDDDFTLVYQKRKIQAQVKFEEISIPIAKEHIDTDKILIGSSINKSLSIFLTYLAQYRNFMASAENAAAKAKVTQDFTALLVEKKIKNISSVPDSWHIDTLPDNKIEELIEFSIMSWGLQKSLIIDRQACLQELLFSIAKKEPLGVSWASRKPCQFFTNTQQNSKRPRRQNRATSSTR